MSIFTSVRGRAAVLTTLAGLGAASVAALGVAPAAQADTPLPTSCTTTSYGFGGDVSALQFNGNAFRSGSLVRLTTSGFSQSGSVFTTQKISLLNGGSFSSRFSFRISGPGNGGADGITFAVQTQSSSATSTGGGLGYAGISPSVGVEFDTYYNPEYGDINDNHLGIDLNGSVYSAQSVALGPLGINLDDNGARTKTAWVDYDGVTKQLEVRIATTTTRPAAATISRTVDIPATLGGTDAYLGFTAATGGAYDTHDIVDWDYSNCYRPSGVDASPFVDAGGPYAGDASTAIPVLGSASDDRTTPLPSTWTATGPGTCTFADPAARSTTVTCDAPGSYTLRLTANDGVNPAVSDTATLTVAAADQFALVLTPATATRTVDSTHTVSAALTNRGAPVAGRTVRFTVSGPNATTFTAVTDADGVAQGSYPGHATGTDTVVATFDNNGDSTAEASASATATWVNPYAVALTPSSAIVPVGGTHDVTATVTDGSGPVAGARVTFTVTGAHPRTVVAVTDDQGRAVLTLSESTPGTDQVVAAADVAGDGTTEATDNAQVVWEAATDVALTKTADREQYAGGDPVTYTLTATNTGTTPARAVTISDPVPADVLVTAVDAPCSVTGQQVTCPLGDLAGSASRTVTVHGTFTGAAPGPDTPSQGDHQLDVVKHDLSWALEPGEQQTLGLTCPDGGIVTDVSTVTSGVDQGTGTPSDVETRAIGPVTTSRGEAVLVNHATGRAQGHLYLTCLASATTVADGHSHGIVTDPDTTVTSLLPAGVQTVTLPVGLDRVGTAPGYVVQAGSARLLGSEPTSAGRRLTYLVAPGGAMVRSTVRPLHVQTTPAGSPAHVHDLRLSDQSVTVDVPTGRSTVNVTCPDSGKGITALYRLPVGVTAGDEPQPVTRSFTLDNATGETQSVRVGVTCLGGRTSGPVAPGSIVTNTATVSSPTVDPDPADNTAEVSVVVRRAVDAGPVAGPAGPTGPVGPVAPPVAPRATYTASAPLNRRSRFLVGRLTSTVTGRVVVEVRSARGRLGRATVAVTAGRPSTLKVRLKKHAGRASVLVVRQGSTTTRIRLR